ncbi:MAG: NADH-quinone oxidoreductase subunit L [Planctomycetaceae bacterium]|nr:NADH-quinone oxidoreductase subunit L [Planctomycetaceae bacterium]
MPYETTGETIKTLLTMAWLLPLFGFGVEIFAGYWQRDRFSKAAAQFAVGCIGLGFLFSSWALMTYVQDTGWSVRFEHESAHHAELVTAIEEGKPLPGHGGHDHEGHNNEHNGDHGHDHGEEGHSAISSEDTSLAQYAIADPVVAEKPGHDHHADHEHAHDYENEHSGGHVEGPAVFSGIYYRLASFGDLEINIEYYIDTLTLVMFTMVTFIATCIHIFALGYMADELTDDYVDHQAHYSNGKHVHRPGRFYKFFAFLSLFCFSMLGLVIAGNIFQVFVFWELVGVCSYFLIGFYVERKSASTAANKAFIMNRVGDFGFLIGLMVIWTSFGTFKFAEPDLANTDKPAGLFQMIRGTDGELDVDNEAGVVYLQDGHGERLKTAEGNEASMPYWLLVVAGLGVFGGCIGKSAQFPLQTWLPDAMEGPTPVSALVHSATMVAAGVYLAGRFYPMFTPEVLLVIAYVGAITLFLAATIAMVVTDIKQVLAYSTISQLGYMMLGLGLFGWAAGLFHLITHAFFKSLLFLCSGSVIAACHHEQEMPKMGGLIRKLPITGTAMLVGVVAIAGLSIPGVSFGLIGNVVLVLGLILGILAAYKGDKTQIPMAATVVVVGGLLTFTDIANGKAALSGFHSKDAIVATALTYFKMNPAHLLLFILPLITAGLTAFYMFRLWFYTFLGKPRDQHVYDHCKESPLVMTGPLIALSVLAAFCAIGGEGGKLFVMLSESAPAGIHDTIAHVGTVTLNLPGHIDVLRNHASAGNLATIAAFSGTLIAFMIYGLGLINPTDIKSSLSGVHSYLSNKWYFDELYDTMFMKPAHIVARYCTAIDKWVFDAFLHWLSRATLWISKWDRMFDEKFVDGLVNLLGTATFSVGSSFGKLQTGQMRQYVMFIAVAVVALSVVLFVWFPH